MFSLELIILNNFYIKELNSYGSTTFTAHAETGLSCSNSTAGNIPSSTQVSNKLGSMFSSSDLKDAHKLSTNVISSECPSGGSNRDIGGGQKGQRRSWTSFKLKSFKLTSTTSNSRNRALTITLFGVVAIFFLCHFPAVIAKIIYVVYPKMEFENKSMFASVCLDISNFLIMLNSSINFILYIVFGPGKFREEFSIICATMFSCCLKYFRFGSRNSNSNNSNSNFNNSRNGLSARSSYETNRLKKCSFQSNSEFNINSTASTPMIDITCEKLNEISSK